MKVPVIILGSGIAGLSAAYYLKKNGIQSLILEKEDDYGGLCNSFEINGFTFDNFAHISFDNEQTAYDMLEGKTEHYIHKPEALNFSEGLWIKNPVQNNLIDLPVDERVQVIDGFVNRDKNIKIENYRDWLYSCFGQYFTDHYPARYTRKYWTVEPEKLESQWISGRMNVPTLKEMLKGAMEETKEVLHYSKEARYPKKGGFKAFLSSLAKDADIRYAVRIRKIDSAGKKIELINGENLEYDRLISTIPLPDLCELLSDMPEEIRERALKLDHTSGAMISIGLKKSKTSPSLWFYIYDEDILPARVYAPDHKSPANVPSGCSALQAEVYFSKYKPMPSDTDHLKDMVMDQMLRLGLFEENDVLFSDIRTKQYANIMFTPDIYSARNKIHEYLDRIGIRYAGRWGEWDYLWVGQSFRSGKKAAEECCG